MSRLTTVEEFRDCKRVKTPLFSVVWLPYLESPNKRHDGWGREEDIFTALEEARARYAELATTEAKVEECELQELRYDSRGGCTWWPLDEWRDPTEPTD